MERGDTSTWWVESADEERAKKGLADVDGLPGLQLAVDFARQRMRDGFRVLRLTGPRNEAYNEAALKVFFEQG